MSFVLSLSHFDGRLGGSYPSPLLVMTLKQVPRRKRFHGFLPGFDIIPHCIGRDIDIEHFF